MGDIFINMEILLLVVILTLGSQEPREGYSLTSKHGVYSPSDIRLDTRNHPIITISTTDTVTKLEPLFSDILLAHNIHYILSSIDPSDFEKIDKAKVEKTKLSMNSEALTEISNL